MTISMQQQGKGALTIDITGVASADAGGQGALANPEGVSIMILRTTLYIRAKSTGAANLGIGIAANATTKATDILNDLAMGGVAAGEVYNGHAMQNTAKTGITAPALWTTDKFLTFTGSASLVGMDASLYIEYLRV
jgi:spermidine/putrescine-binding protein